jgi:hypothetical protein
MAPRIETAEDLETIVAEQTAAIVAMGQLVRGMDLRIKALTALVDHHHELFTKQGLAIPRPKGDTNLAN